MNRATYEKAKEARAQAERPPRARCARCRKAAVTCYCSRVLPFEAQPQFVILIHRDENRRGVATGRMAHLCVANSWLVEGTDFTDHDDVNRWLADPAFYPVILYPSPAAINLSELSACGRAELFPAGRRPLIFVIDGTWASARKMRRLSRNLQSLPLLSFTPRGRSLFEVRKQPRPECLSTLEAIHQTLDLLQDWRAERPHDNLLDVFQFMVRTQQKWEAKNGRRAVRGIR